MWKMLRRAVTVEIRFARCYDVLFCLFVVVFCLFVLLLLILVIISSLHRELSPACTLKWPGRNTSSGYHVHNDVCNVVLRDNSVIKSDRVQIACILAFMLLAEITNRRRRRRNRSTRRKPLTTSFRKCHILKPEDSSPKRDSNPHSIALVAG